MKILWKINYILALIYIIELLTTIAYDITNGREIGLIFYARNIICLFIGIIVVCKLLNNRELLKHQSKNLLVNLIAVFRILLLVGSMYVLFVENVFVNDNLGSIGSVISAMVMVDVAINFTKKYYKT